jgi:hypothetical protein
VRRAGPGNGWFRIKKHAPDKSRGIENLDSPVHGRGRAGSSDTRIRRRRRESSVT